MTRNPFSYRLGNGFTHPELRALIADVNSTVFSCRFIGGYYPYPFSNKIFACVPPHLEHVHFTYRSDNEQHYSYYNALLTWVSEAVAWTTYYEKNRIEKSITIRTQEEKRKCLMKVEEESQKALTEINFLQQRLIHEYAKIYDELLRRKPQASINFERGLIYFNEGKAFEGISHIAAMIKCVPNSTPVAFDTDMQINWASGLVEIGQYEQAILVLSTEIEKDPNNQLAYLERASAYFEVGDFDLCLKDYLHYKSKEPEVIKGSSCFCVGLVKGLKNGVHYSSTEFLPNILSSAKGLGNLIWATIEHPIDTPKELAVAISDFCIYLKTCDKTELIQILTPEMYELVINWDDLDPYKKGELAGYCLGKYGTDILLPIACMKGFQYVKKYQSIKKFDKIATFETLAGTESRQLLQDETLKWQARKQTFFAKIQLEVDKQAKHIPGKHNYEPGKSEWTHPQPQRLLTQHAGKGQKIRGIPGEANYRERVDFGELIGYYVDLNQKEKIPTTVGIIHYSKDGAHIVPAAPKP